LEAGTLLDEDAVDQLRDPVWLVRDVLVAGRFAKRDGKLLHSNLASVRARLAASGERILGRLNVPSISRQIAAE